MKASDHSTCVVPATAVEILLTLAQYISSTPRTVPLKDRTGRANTYLLRAAFRRSLSSVRPNEAHLMLVILCQHL